MTESNVLRELTEAVNLRKVGYAKVEKLTTERGLTKQLSLDEPLSANKSASVQLAFWLDARWEVHKPLLEAFRRFQLDPDKPSHWRLLLESFVEVAMKRPGPKNKLVRNKYAELSHHVAQLKHEDRNLESDSEIARRLKSDKRFKAHYSSIALRTLRGHVHALYWGSFEENFREQLKMMEESGFLAPGRAGENNV
ncbi:hypothetical protein [Bradyrhizobium septentrionale]|uniref:Uncharacterized protein n=1 Tax=Bradyrhizobium septentrionale TaxID=1404411 RepID=A0ABZ2P260_9BRAD